MSPLILLFALLSQWIYTPTLSPPPWGLTPLLIEERVAVVTDKESGTCVVVFRGTDSIDDFFEDLISQVTDRCDNEMGILKPFLDSYKKIDMQKVKDVVKGPECRTKGIYLTGHSLGGAMASIAKLKSDVYGKVVTFGEPRTCCNTDHETYGLRVVNKRDPIPALPLHTNVRHCANHGLLLPSNVDQYGKRWPSLPDNYSILDHRMSHYITDLSNYINTMEY